MTHPDSTPLAVLTIPQVAEQLGCSRVHVYRLINAGALEAVDIAVPGSPRTKMRILVDDLNGYITSSTRG